MSTPDNIAALIAEERSAADLAYDFDDRDLHKEYDRAKARTDAKIADLTTQLAEAQAVIAKARRLNDSQSNSADQGEDMDRVLLTAIRAEGATP